MPHGVHIQATEAGRRCVPLQSLLVEVYEKEGTEAGLDEAAQVCEKGAGWLDDDHGWMDSCVPQRSANLTRFKPAKQICETLGTELDPVRVRYWLGVVQARIHRRLVADLRSPSASAV